MAIEVKDCLENDVCFGHLSKKWSPNMKNFILMKKDNVHIINANETIKQLKISCKFITDSVAKGGRVLFVCTKKAFKHYIITVAKDLEMPYITEKWFGGILTNFVTVRKMIKRIENVNKMIESPSFSFLAKKEQLIVKRNLNKKKIVLDGISNMFKMPSIIFIVDAKHEWNTVLEARTKGIPIIALADTNIDPDYIDYPIPANDDSLKSVKLITEEIKNAILLGYNKCRELNDVTDLDKKNNTKIIKNNIKNKDTNKVEKKDQNKQDLSKKVQLSISKKK